MSVVSRDQLIDMIESLQQTSNRIGTTTAVRVPGLNRAAVSVVAKDVMVACETQLRSCEEAQRHLSTVIDPFRVAVSTKPSDDAWSNGVDFDALATENSR